MTPRPVPLPAEDPVWVMDDRHRTAVATSSGEGAVTRGEAAPRGAYDSFVSNPVGLARLPADVSAGLGACAAALTECVAQLDVVLVRVDDGMLQAIGERRAACGDATVALIAAVGSSRRAGPDRIRLTALARATDRTAEAVEAAAWAWARHPVPEAGDVLRALRDATRAAARAVEALEDEGRRLTWDARCREREAEARFLARSARGELLARQDDVARAAAAHDVLTYASLWQAALAKLRAAVLHCAPE